MESQNNDPYESDRIKFLFNAMLHDLNYSIKQLERTLYEFKNIFSNSNLLKYHQEEIEFLTNCLNDIIQNHHYLLFVKAEHVDQYFVYEHYLFLFTILNKTADFFNLVEKSQGQYTNESNDQIKKIKKLRLSFDDFMNQEKKKTQFILDNMDSSKKI